MFYSKHLDIFFHKIEDFYYQDFVFYKIYFVDLIENKILKNIWFLVFDVSLQFYKIKRQKTLKSIKYTKISK